MTREEANGFLIGISYKFGNMGVEYLTEKDGEKMREAIKTLEQEPCEDAISRRAVLEKMADYVASGYADSVEDFEEYSRIICQLPPVNPQYTEDEIQKMQDLEQAEIEKAYELGKTEGQKSEDVISRVETVKFLANHSNEFEDVKIRMAFQAASSLINNPHNLPPVTPQPKTGHWIYDRTRDWDGECKYECSECGVGSDVDYSYCMRCGAKMESEKKE